jgi:hypothetical protein
LRQEAADAAAKQEAALEDELDADLMAGLMASESDPVKPTATRKRALKKSARALEAEADNPFQNDDSG